MAKRTFASRTFASRTFESNTWAGGVAVVVVDASVGSGSERKGFASWFVPAGMTLDDRRQTASMTPVPDVSLDQTLALAEKLKPKKKRPSLMMLDDDFALLTTRR